MASLKGVLFDKLLNYEIELEDIILKIAEKVKGSYSLKLNSEYNLHYDPYIFHKYTRVTSELYD